MALYSDTVMDHFHNPRNVGKMDDADGVGEVGNAKCGDIMKMYLKIDRSFITDLLRDPDDLALTSAIVAMAHSMGVTVVAEGVERAGQFELLRERDCDLVQGYWLGHPMGGQEFVRLLG